MAAIYFHIPFCKQACHYCDFHFSTSLKHKNKLVDALVRELILRKDAFKQPVETIYLGGGTPSLLSLDQVKMLLEAVYNNFGVVANPEITLEANPDDLKTAYLQALSKTQVNRLSIGIQSFFEDDLVLMNRSHTATEALESVQEAKKYFDAISVDLIYGIPNMTLEKWKKNIAIILELDIPHLSAYALTVEPKTALKKFIETGKIATPDDALAKTHYEYLITTALKNGYINYEFSNFGKPGYFSKNNTAYWTAKPYLGIGPSAHSFNGQQRSWNVSNNNTYIKSIQQGILPSEIENLSITDRYNEYIMTGLRTMWGVDLNKITQEFGDKYTNYLRKEATKFITKKMLVLNDNTLHISPKGKFLGDGIASALFYVS
jgi:oxygen-independent coproporphyrinogen-3 oxidase